MNEAEEVEETPEINRIVNSWHPAKAADTVSLTTSEYGWHTPTPMQAHMGNV